MFLYNQYTLTYFGLRAVCAVALQASQHWDLPPYPYALHPVCLQGARSLDPKPFLSPRPFLIQSPRQSREEKSISNAA